jgi:uncharacterized protein (TIGR02284 family)
MNSEDTIDALNTLIETCKDGEYGFRTSADRAESAALKQTLRARADGCQRSAAELHGLVIRHGGTPETSGTAAASVHRGWVSLKMALTGNKDLAVLEECEHAEEAAVAQYRDCLYKDPAPEVRAVIERQFEGAVRNHIEIRTMRDVARLVAA